VSIRLFVETNAPELVERGVTCEPASILPEYPAPAHELENVICDRCLSRVADGWLVDPDDYGRERRPLCVRCADWLVEGWAT
jgi:hypothetical protein